MRVTIATGLFCLAAIIELSAGSMAAMSSAEPVLRPGTEITQKCGWFVVNDYRPRRVQIFDSLGVAHPFAVPDRAWVLALDRIGNVLAGTRLNEDATLATYYTRNGQKIWEYPVTNFGGLVLSPDGAYAMKGKGVLRQFSVFATQDTADKRPNPFSGLQNDSLYAGEFSDDGAVILLTASGRLLRYNPSSGFIEREVIVRSPTGEPMVLNGEPHGDVSRSNPDHTRFADMLYEASDRGERRMPWLLIYDSSPRVISLRKMTTTIHSSRFVGDRLLVVRGKNSSMSLDLVLLGDSMAGETVLDTNADNWIHCAVASGDAVFTFGWTKGGRKYSLGTSHSAMVADSVPLFRRRHRDAADRVFVPVQFDSLQGGR